MTDITRSIMPLRHNALTLEQQVFTPLHFWPQDVKQPNKHFFPGQVTLPIPATTSQLCSDDDPGLPINNIIN